MPIRNSACPVDRSRENEPRGVYSEYRSAESSIIWIVSSILFVRKAGPVTGTKELGFESNEDESIFARRVPATKFSLRYSLRYAHRAPHFDITRTRGKSRIDWETELDYAKPFRPEWNRYRRTGLFETVAEAHTRSRAARGGQDRGFSGRNSVTVR